MKTHLINRGLGSLVLGVLLLAGMIAPQEAEAKNYRGISFQVFYDELSPYGDWVKDARYGYIWLPAVREDFHPYGTEGHWVMTEYGNTWVSYYDWGWAPFHYGRWYFDDYFQSWAWIPGYDWGPAWVNWRTGGGYYGWAPLGPGVSINVRVNIPSFHWVFIPNHNIYHHHAYRYHAPHKTKIKIYNQTTIINNTVVYNNQTYVGGPQRREVERVTRSVVPVYQLQASNAPGRAAVSRNSVSMYRPEMQESRSRTTEARPTRVLDAQQAKTGRSNREVYSSSPSRSANTNGNSGVSGRSETSSGRTATPTTRGENDSFEVKPAPADTKGRGTTTAPSRTQSGSREAAPSRTYESRPSAPSSGQRSTAPSRSGEVRSEGTRTQSQAPSRGTVQQSRSAQAPTRTQAPEVRRSEPARASQPSRIESSRSSSEVKTTAPAKKESSANTRSTGTPSGGRGGSSRDRNN
ncbi:hypothetical protein D0X99_15375 [Algoriphagus lacus]|uniref:Prolin-rich transmembrane protein n=1 Tax=Algoriphagus lacus TaxID=2056311 RepID=A0A418PNN2_9BACT|nr:DUF6600 domain-containing protein [Algoriphagus lacus]RIW13623.1 hypothetical protein D0X99_15375 [Algoriphagus lacus]